MVGGWRAVSPLLGRGAGIYTLRSDQESKQGRVRELFTALACEAKMSAPARTATRKWRICNTKPPEIVLLERRWSRVLQQ